MPYTYEFTDLGVVIITTRGAPSIEDRQRVVDLIAADPAFRPELKVLSDRRHAEEVSTTGRVQSGLALLERVGVSMCAIVVSGAAEYGMGRLAAAKRANVHDVPEYVPLAQIGETK